jgi:hypothetical protein
MSKLSRNSYFVESKDGKVRIEEVNDVGNSWEAKIRCVEKWAKQNTVA